MSAPAAESDSLQPRTSDALLHSLRSPFTWLVKFARKKPLGFLGLLLCIFFVVVAVLGPTLTTFNAAEKRGEAITASGNRGPQDG